MLYIVRKSDNKILWKDDAFDSECMNKAEDWMTYNCYCEINHEVTFGGDMVIWVRRF